MALTIDSLEIQIQDNAKKSTGGIDALAKSLGGLKSALGDSNGLASNLAQIAQALKSLSSVGKVNLSSPIKQLEKLQELVPMLGGSQATTLAFNLKEIVNALTSFSTIPKFNLSSIAKGIESLNASTSAFDDTRLAEFSVQMQGIANSLSQLEGVKKSSIGSIVNALKKIPDVTASLDPETITAFSTAVQNVTTAVAPLAADMDKIAAGFKALKNPSSVAAASLNKYSSASKNASNSQTSLLSGITKIISKLGVFYFTVNRVVGVLSGLFDESNEYIESLNLFKVAMGDAADAAQEYAEKVGDAMGIDPAEWMTNQGIFQRMSTGFGISADQAEIMSKNLTQLAYDMSSFFNVDVQTAMDKLSSGMSGQIKGLKEWGYNLSVAALQETALALGIEQSVRTMTEAQKAQLRYITLIMKSNGVMGDMAKTLVTPANAMRVLSAQLTQLKRALGNIVSVLVTKFIPYFQAFVELMKEAATALATLMGFEIKDLDTGNLEMGSDVIDGIGDSADDSIESLEELKKQLAGFDELNILKNEPENDDISYDLGIELPEYDFIGNAFSEHTKIVEDFKEVISDLKDVLENIDLSPIFDGIGNLFNTLREQFKDIDFGQLVADSFGKLLDTIVNIVDLILKVVNILVEALNLPQGVADGLKFLSQLFETIGDIVESITPAIVAIVEALAPIFEKLGGSVSEGFGFLTDVLKGLGDVFKRLKPTITSIGKTIGGIIGKVWEFVEPLVTVTEDGQVKILGAQVDAVFSILENGLPLVDTVLSGLCDGLDDLFEALEPISTLVSTILSDSFGWLADIFSDLADDIIPTLTSTLGNLFENVLSPLAALLTDTLKPVLELISGILTPLWENIISPLIEMLSGKLGETLKSVFDIINTTVIPILSDLVDLLTYIWDELLEPIVNYLTSDVGTTFSEVFGDIGDIIEGLMTTLGGIIDFITGVFTGDWSQAWEGIKEIFSGIWDSLVGLVKAPINAMLATIESFINAIIDGFNGFKEFLTPDSAEANMKRAQHVSIPRLATGGFPAMGQMFIARERGPELVGNIGNKNAVVNNNQIIQGIASGVYSAMMAAREDGDNGSGGTAKIIVQIDGKEVGEASVRYINGQIVQTGASPIYS